MKQVGLFRNSSLQIDGKTLAFLLISWAKKKKNDMFEPFLSYPK